MVNKIIIPGSAGKGSYMEIMPGGKHDPQFLVSHWWGGVFPPRCHVYFGACHTTLGQELASVRKLCSSGRVHMEVQPLVRASVENLEDLSQDMYVAPLNGANTICTNECRPGQTLEMEREQLSRSSLHNNIIVRWPSYFVGEGLRLLYCGAFDEGELPYDFRNRQGGRAPCRCLPSNLANTKARKTALHSIWRPVIRRDKHSIATYWFELAAPDGRPYFYDFVSHMHK